MKYLLHRLLILLLLVSCRRDESTFVPDQTQSINSDLLLSNFISTPNSIIVGLNDGNTVVSLNEGLIIEINEGSLLNNDGSPVQGEIRIEVKEYAEKKYHLLKAPSLIYDSQPLNCKKLISIGISQNGKKLQINQPVFIYLKEHLSSINNKYQVFTSQNTDMMSAWYSEYNDKYEINTADFVIHNEESILKIHGYKIELKNNNSWYCIAESLNAPSKEEKSIGVSFDNIINQTNTLAYFLGDDFKTAFKLDADIEKRKFYQKINPVGSTLSGKIILISQFSDKNVQFGMTNVVLGKDTEVSVNLQSKSIEDIKAILESL